MVITTETITETPIITAVEDSEIQTVAIRTTREIKVVVDSETKAIASKIEVPTLVQEALEVQAALTAADQKHPMVDLTVAVSETVRAAAKTQVLLQAPADSKTAAAVALDKLIINNDYK